MKTLYMIGGPMGVGKSATCRALQQRLPRCVMLDGDWCWSSRPFLDTPETRKMVLENIVFLLGQFLRCEAYEHIVFCWVIHEQGILDAILSRLDTEDVRVLCFSLVCSDKALAERFMGDVASGLRQPGDLSASLARLPLYEAVSSRKVDTTGLTPIQAADLLIRLSGGRD